MSNKSLFLKGTYLLYDFNSGEVREFEKVTSESELSEYIVEFVHDMIEGCHIGNVEELALTLIGPFTNCGHNKSTKVLSIFLSEIPPQERQIQVEYKL